MPGHNDDLLRMLRSFPICNHVMAFRARQRLGSQRKPHANWTLLRKVGEQIGIFGCNRGCGKRPPVRARKRRAGMRQAIIRSAHRADEHCRGTHACRDDGTRCSIYDCFPVRGSTIALCRELLVVTFVEEQDFALRCIGRPLP
jgi:hypothetical protein